MAKLTTKGRRKIAAKNFVFPKGKGPDTSKAQYPIHDKAHAINALSRGKQNLSSGQYAVLKRKVCNKFPDLPACKR